MTQGQIALFQRDASSHEADANSTLRTMQLFVVRSYAHAHELKAHLAHLAQKGQSHRHAIWTLRDLYERISLLGLLTSNESIDDDAHTMAAALVSSAHSPFALRQAIDLRNLHRQLSHVGTQVQSIADRVALDSARGLELAERFTQVARINDFLQKAKVVSRGEALLRGVLALEEGAKLLQLAPFSRVHIVNAIDPTTLEVRALCALAQSGVPLSITLPVDERGRGLAEATDWIARRFEALEAPDFELNFEPLGRSGSMRAFCDALFAPTLLPEVHAPVRVLVARDRTEEAREIARQVAGWRDDARANQQELPRVAVAFRSIDAHTRRVADALSRFDVPVKERMGTPLSDTPPAQLLLDVLSARREGVPRDLLLNILASRAYKNALPPGEVGDIARRLRRAVARSDVEDVTRQSGGYRHRLERLASGAQSDNERDEIAYTITSIEDVIAEIATLKKRATLEDHLEDSAEVLRRMCDEDDENASELYAQLKDWSRALNKIRQASKSSLPGEKPKVDLSAYVRFLSRALSEVRLAPKPNRAARAVELISLPDLFGREFDFVVVADCVHGRLPLALSKDEVLGDGDRKLVNRAMKSVVLRVYEDDTLEPSPVPARMALEPLWFMGAISAASKGVFLSASSKDERGREIAPSAFLEEALIAMGAAPDETNAGFKFAKAADPRTQRVDLAHARMCGDEIPDDFVSEESLTHIDHLAEVALHRAQFFFGDQSSDAFAYDFGSGVGDGVSHRLGVNRNQPLGPTRLEALAQCGLRGMVEQLLRIDTSPEGGQDADARVVGTLAHNVLEAFYKERPGIVRERELKREDRDRLRELVKQNAEPLLEGRTTGHLAALEASFSWLEEALLRAVTVLTKTPPLPKAMPVHFECKVGTRGYDDPALEDRSYGPVPIPVGERTLYFGGEIDRIDESDGVRVVVDYKNQSASQVRSKLRGESVFSTHFQLPLYLRFLEHHDPSPPGTRLYAYLVPLRDGDIRHDDVLGAHPDFARRVLNDERSDGLAKSLERVLNPFFEGKAAPNQGGHCRSCRLSRVCRVPSAVSKAPSVFLPVLKTPDEDT